MRPDKLPTDDLDYLAGLGYEFVATSQTDLDKLQAKGRTRFGRIDYTLFIYLTCGLFLGGTLFFMVINSEKIYPTYPEKQVVLTSDLQDLDTLPVANLPEQPVLPENYKRPVKARLSPAATDSMVITLSETDTTAVLHLQSRNLFNNQRKPETSAKLKFLVNSPLTFIHDLKVSDYQKLYFKRQVHDDFGGIPAAFSFEPAKSSHEFALKTKAEIFLHQELSAALLNFKRENYDESISLLYTIKTYNPGDINCSFYLGMCYYFKQNYARALVYLEDCIVSTNNAFVQEAIYYKAICLKETGRADEALILLKRIAEEGGFYAEKALAALN